MAGHIKSSVQNTPAEVEKLADVIALMPEPERSRMTAVRGDLKDVLEAVQIKTRHNAELLKASSIFAMLLFCI